MVAAIQGPPAAGYNRELRGALNRLERDGLLTGFELVRVRPADAEAQLIELADRAETAVVVRGDSFEEALTSVAPARPEQTFVWIPGGARPNEPWPPLDQPNVAAIYADVAPAGFYVAEMLAGAVPSFGNVGYTEAGLPRGDDAELMGPLFVGLGVDPYSLVEVPAPAPPTSSLDASEADALASFDLVVESGERSRDFVARVAVRIAGDVSSESGAREIALWFRYDVALGEILGAETLPAEPFVLTFDNGGLRLVASEDDDTQQLRRLVQSAAASESSAPSTDTEPAESTPSTDTEPAESAPSTEAERAERPACSFDTTLQRGASGDAVECLQTVLDDLGVYAGEIDGLFGSDTYNAVIAFQLDNGLDADGIVGEQTGEVLGVWGPPPTTTTTTLPAPTCSFAVTLERGSVGPEVECLQTVLSDLGYYTGEIDGAFGADTESAVRAYQELRGHTADGVVGPLTGETLGVWDPSASPASSTP